MLSLRDFAAAVYALTRLLRFDATAFDWFDATPSGFWRSFWVAVMIAPVYAIQSTATYIGAGVTADPLSYALVDLFTYVIGWVLFPLVMIRVSGWVERWPRYFHFVVAYNWFQLVIGAVLLPLVIGSATGLFDPAAVQTFFVMFAAVMLGYGWFIAHKGLQVSGFTAVGIVILDMLLSALVNGAAEALIQG